MTTDLVKYGTTVKGGPRAPATFYPHDFWAPAREEKAPAPAGKAGLAEKYEQDRDGFRRCMGATVALLKYAHEMLDRAEALIESQARRIAALEDLTTTDELTGLKNRRGFFEAFTQDLDRCNRGLSAGGLLILVDLDNFKAVNDTYGHLAGDACLRLVARTLANEIRVMDAAARLGGDEFVLLLSNTTKGEAAARAQDLAWQLNRLALAWYGESIPVRASLGLQGYKAGDGADRVFGEADLRLYADKDRKKKREAAADK